MSLITIIGRGHSGTRAISHTLYASGVYMGDTINNSGDKIPPQDLYESCRIIAKHVKWNGGLNWDFSELHTMKIPAEFQKLVDRYLGDVIKNRSEHKGWKLPETTLIFPWIVRMFPEIKFIYWVRDPRDCVIGAHLTDNLNDFGIQYPETQEERLRRAISWKYQYELVKSTPVPKHWLTVRFEDFVLKQEETVKRIEDYLGIPLCRIIVRADAIGRYKTDKGQHMFNEFADAMKENGYA